MVDSWLLPALLLSSVGFVVTPLTMPQRAASRISSMSAVSRKILMAPSVARMARHLLDQPCQAIDSLVVLTACMRSGSLRRTPLVYPPAKQGDSVSRPGSIAGHGAVGDPLIDPFRVGL